MLEEKDKIDFELEFMKKSGMLSPKDSSTGATDLKKALQSMNSSLGFSKKGSSKQSKAIDLHKKYIQKRIESIV